MALCHPLYIECMFRAAARYRLAMMAAAEACDGVYGAEDHAARTALGAEGIMCLTFDELAEAVITLGEYRHRYDRQDEQLAIISSFFDSMYFGKILL